MSTMKRALIAASFVLVAATTAQAQAPGHSGGAVAIGSDGRRDVAARDRARSSQPAALPRGHGAAPARNYGAVAIGADSASGQPVARLRAVPVQRYQGATEGARAIGSDR